MAYSNSNMTSRIVVGFGLAAACAIGVSIFAVQARQQMANQAAFNASTQSLADSSAVSGAAGASGQQFSAPPPPTEPAVIQPAAQPVESPAVAPQKPRIVKATPAKAVKAKKPVDAEPTVGTDVVPAAPAPSVLPPADAAAPTDTSPPAAAPVDAPARAPDDATPAAAAPAVADPTTLIDNGQQPQ